MMVLGPVVADHTFGPRGWGLILAAMTGGLILGGLIAMRIRTRRLLLFAVASCFPTPMPLLALAFHSHIAVVVCCGLAAGVFWEQYSVAWTTTMQEHIPPANLARVYSFEMVGSLVGMPVGEAAVGPLAHAFGVETTLIGASVLIVLSGIAMLSSGEVRTLPHQQKKSALAPTAESRS